MHALVCEMHAVVCTMGFHMMGYWQFVTVTAETVNDGHQEVHAVEPSGHSLDAVHQQVSSDTMRACQN